MISDLIFVFSLFWIYFYARCESVVKSDSFACSCPVFLTPFVEEAVFSALYIVPSFFINKLPIGFISGLSFLFHWVSDGVGDVIQLTRWTWVWVSSRNWWWGGRPGMLQSVELQRVRHDWWLNWTNPVPLNYVSIFVHILYCFDEHRCVVVELGFPYSLGITSAVVITLPFVDWPPELDILTILCLYSSYSSHCDYFFFFFSCKRRSCLLFSTLSH